MKRTIGVIVFGVVAFAAIVLARLPASWLLPTGGARFSCASVDGSLWSGYCSGLTVRGAALGDLTWQLRPARLLLGKVAAHIDLEHPPSASAQGDVEIGLGGTAGSLRGKKPFRTLWSLGYMLAAISSLIIGTSFALHYSLGIYYLGAAGLGFATGSVETFEPVLTSTLVKSSKLSSGMGWLSSSRALGLFVSNIVVGVLFVFSQFDSYLYAALTAFAAGAILLAIELKTKVR